MPAETPGPAGLQARHGRAAALREAVGAALWPVPTLIVVLAVGLGIGLPALDEQVDHRLPVGLQTLLFGGQADAARQLLSAIASGLITTVSLVFSLTVVVFQLASSQYSPRLLRLFPRDGLVRATLGVLVGAFVYALTVLRSVRGEQVPRLSVSLAFVVTVAGALLLVFFLGHLVTELRVETMLQRVHREQQALQRSLLDDDPEAEQPPSFRPEELRRDQPGVLLASRSGVLTTVDEHGLLELARELDLQLSVLRAVGEQITAGTPVVLARRAGVAPDGGASGPAEVDDRLRAGVEAALTVGYERTAAQDLGYGLQQLTDIYVKALSPGINDPTTAIASLGHLAALLAELAAHRLGARTLRDSDDQLRLVVAGPEFDQMLDSALGPLRRYGSSDPAVVLAGLRLLRDVGWAVHRPAQRQAVAEQLERLRAAAERNLDDPRDLARVADAAEQVRQALAGRW